ncbi:WD repeat-containing protein 25-like [Chenopodium quinoa]|nr:WD repeat-containing protein 25-like [Chenopodium quinoa]
MDLLCKTYSNSSEDEDEQQIQPSKIIPPPSKRPKPYYTPIHKPVFQAPNPQIGAPNSSTGRYISKREKALMASASTTHADPLPTLPPSPEMGSISSAYVRPDILLSLKKRTKTCAEKNKLPFRLSIGLNGHVKAVNAVQWSTSHAHLLASAGMDNFVYIWNVWSEQHKKARVFSFHNAAVKDVRWSPQGQFILSCGYDCSSRLVDVEKGMETQNFTEDQAVTAIKFHPHNSNLFLSGGSKGLLKLWDIRAGKVVHEYVRRLGPILDVEFINDGKQFISSSDVSQTNLSENSLIVWDVSREVPLSNQVYVEAYTCPCVRCHPFEPSFVAQSNGNYIAIFSNKRPFRLDKYKRYESHGVFGFPVKCCFNLDGEILASGSSDGEIYFYSVRSSNLVKKVKAYNQPCTDVAFHPVIPNVIACCSWGGEVSVIE